MANNLRFLPNVPAHTFQIGLLETGTTTTDQLLYRKLLTTVQLLQIGQTTAAQLMVTHVIEVLDQSNATHTALYPIARKLATDIASQQGEISTNTRYGVGRATRNN